MKKSELTTVFTMKPYLAHSMVDILTDQISLLDGIENPPEDVEYRNQLIHLRSHINEQLRRAEVYIMMSHAQIEAMSQLVECATAGEDYWSKRQRGGDVIVELSTALWLGKTRIENQVNAERKKSNTSSENKSYHGKVDSECQYNEYGKPTNSQRKDSWLARLLSSIIRKLKWF